MWVTSALNQVLTPTIVALGNFDGIHQGHREVIQGLQVSKSGAEYCYTTVVAFDPHPQEFFTGQPRLLLTPTAEKVDLLTQLGVEQLLLLPFNAQLVSLSPQDFVEQILVKELGAYHISVGFNFCFGYQRTGTVVELEMIARQHQVSVTIAAPQTQDHLPISSSAIRTALEQGQLQQANQMLGRAYRLQGEVIRGQQLGQTLGFPTANLRLPPEKFLPRQGVYSVRVQNECWDGSQIGVMNLGCRPTVDGHQQTIEVHLLDWSGDLYGHTLIVHLEQFLRPEHQFSSLEALKAQIQADCEAARSFLTSRV